MSGVGRPITSTYRLQLHAGFGFAEVAELADYLADLGVSHAYLSPVLQATRGSTHGYDVVDHTRLSDDLGGAEAYDAMVHALAARGVGVVVDVVPNHVALPVPESDSQPLWSVLREGAESPFAAWFDVDWDTQQPLLLPVLGERIDQALDASLLSVDPNGSEPVLRYRDHEFPLRPGTEGLPLEELVEAQHYRLAYWRVATEELNYRRFFDVGTLAGLRIEDPSVFAETHALLVALVHEGKLDGLRIDHPDGLADPRGYLRRLAESTGGAWVVVEKILAGDETLPDDWPCAGTTGYDALRRIDGLFVEPAGLSELVRLHDSLPGAPGGRWHEVAEDAKREVAKHLLQAEVQRLVEVATAVGTEDIRLRDHTRRSLARAIIELLVALPVYRAYVVPGEPATPAGVRLLEAATAAAAALTPDLSDELAVVRDLALGRFGRSVRKDEFVVRFQQTCGPVVAKGVEDTAGYRWYPLASLVEVGGEPDGPDLGIDAFHAFAAAQQERLPAAMTTLSTHDTKRSADARARISALSERPADAEEWFAAFVGAGHAAAGADGATVPDRHVQYLVWQNLLGTWPITPDRASTWLTKAMREAKQHTSWQSVDADYEGLAQAWLAAMLTDDTVAAGLAAAAAVLDLAAAATTLSAALVQLTMPGVPDTYQGCEAVDRSLVDPDNRRPVDYARRRSLIGAWRPGGTLDAAKVHVVGTALRLRAEQPETYAAAYEPLYAAGPAAEHAVAFVRGGRALTVATRLAHGLERRGGWGRTALALPPGTWVDRLTGRSWSGAVALAELLDTLPVALLTRQG